MKSIARFTFLALLLPQVACAVHTASGPGYVYREPRHKHHHHHHDNGRHAGWEHV